MIHTVGPIYSGSEHDPADLYNCYRNSLELAKENGLHSIGFPGISTGVYGYPKEEAAQTALKAIDDWISANPEYDMRIVIVSFSRSDDEIYKKAMGE